MNIDESFKAYKNQNYKIGFTIKLDDDEKITKKLQSNKQNYQI